MEEKKTIDYIIERCGNLKGENRLSLKLQLLDLLLLIQKAARELHSKIKQLEVLPLIDLLYKQQYEEYEQKVEELERSFRVPPAFGIPSPDYSTHVIDYLFPGERIDLNRKNAEDVRTIINTLESEAFDSKSLWEGGIKNGLHDLADCLKEMVKLSEKQWSAADYKQLAIDLTQKHTNQFNPSMIKAREQFRKWKEGSYGDPEEYQALVADHLKRLLESDFLIIESEHLVKLYKNKIDDLYLYIEAEECTEEHLKKFYFLSKLIEHKEGQFSFTKEAALGKYIFLHRGFLKTEDIEAFFFFQNICLLVNEEMGKVMGVETANESLVVTPQNVEGDHAETVELTIPQDCKAAIDKVLIPEFTIKDGSVMKSRRQITDAARKVDINSNKHVAMLMKIGLELKAVRPGTSCPDFVRALIGLGVLEFKGFPAISRMADGMAKKINGYKSKGKTYPPLPDYYQLWSSNDKEIGQNIYENMISQDN